MSETVPGFLSQVIGEISGANGRHPSQSWESHTILQERPRNEWILRLYSSSASIKVNFDLYTRERAQTWLVKYNQPPSLITTLSFILKISRHNLWAPFLHSPLPFPYASHARLACPIKPVNLPDRTSSGHSSSCYSQEALSWCWSDRYMDNPGREFMNGWALQRWIASKTRVIWWIYLKLLTGDCWQRQRTIRANGLIRGIHIRLHALDILEDEWYHRFNCSAKIHASDTVNSVTDCIANE